MYIILRLICEDLSRIGFYGVVNMVYMQQQRHLH